MKPHGKTQSDLLHTSIILQAPIATFY